MSSSYASPNDSETGSSSNASPNTHEENTNKPLQTIIPGLAKFVYGKNGGLHLFYNSVKYPGHQYDFMVKTKGGTLYYCQNCDKQAKTKGLVPPPTSIRVRDGFIEGDPDNPVNPHICLKMLKTSEQPQKAEKPQQSSSSNSQNRPVSVTKRKPTPETVSQESNMKPKPDTTKANFAKRTSGPLPKLSSTPAATLDFGVAKFIKFTDKENGSKELFMTYDSKRFVGKKLKFTAIGDSSSTTNVYECLGCRRLASKLGLNYIIPTIKTRENRILDDPDNPKNEHFCRKECRLYPRAELEQRKQATDTESINQSRDETPQPRETSIFSMNNESDERPEDPIQGESESRRRNLGHLLVRDDGGFPKQLSFKAESDEEISEMTLSHNGSFASPTAIGVPQSAQGRNQGSSTLVSIQSTPVEQGMMTPKPLPHTSLTPNTSHASNQASMPTFAQTTTSNVQSTSHMSTPTPNLNNTSGHFLGTPSNNENFVYEVNVANYLENDVKVEFVNGFITVKGLRILQDGDQEEMSFQRRLPVDLDINSIEYDYDQENQKIVVTGRKLVFPDIRRSIPKKKKI